MPSDLALLLTLISSNYTYLEHIFMVQKLFELWSLKFYYSTKYVESNTQKLWNPIRIGMQLIGRQLTEVMAQVYLHWHTNILKPLMMQVNGNRELPKRHKTLNRSYKIVCYSVTHMLPTRFSGTICHLFIASKYR